MTLSVDLCKFQAILMLPQEWENHPDVLYAHPLVEAGKKVVGGGDGLPTWVCEFMVRACVCAPSVPCVRLSMLYRLGARLIALCLLCLPFLVVPNGLFEAVVGLAVGMCNCFHAAVPPAFGG